MSKNFIAQDECRQIQLSIMQQIDDICKNNQLNYYIAYGSLLGAIRHKGYIPWDDDIDIIMPRADYRKFLNLIKKRQVKMDDRFYLIDSDQENYYYPFAKMVDNRTVAKMEDNLTEHGIWIDIFPIDGLPNNFLAKLHINLCLFLRATVISMTTDFTASDLGGKSVVKKVLNTLAQAVGMQRINRFEEKVMQKYSDRNTKYVACLFSPYGQREKVEASVLFQATVLLFEGKYFQAPANWDEFLSRVYGNYMELPPEEKRRTHRIVAWYK